MKDNFSEKRKALVQQMKESGIIASKSVEQAFLEVKREAFFPDEIRQLAYDDSAFPTMLGQSISQPSTIAVMLEMLSCGKGMKVLEIGSGTGYVIALLSKMVGEKGKVFGMDIYPEFIEQAEKNLLAQGIKNFELKNSDGNFGLAEKAPFDRILISAGCNNVPENLFGQLSETGILVAPMGNLEYQEITKFEKKNNEIFEREKQGWFSFVPLQTGKQETQEEWKGVT